jgi:hypothetical protein
MLKTHGCRVGLCKNTCRVKSKSSTGQKLNDMAQDRLQSAGPGWGRVLGVKAVKRF